jgi:hypothetical protein
VIELFQREISDASLNDSKPLTEAVADLRKRMVEIGFTPNQVPDTLLEAVILAMRRARTRGEEKQRVQMAEADKVAGKETKTA